ncbi:hypothetical protein BD779DRAFT_722287 [Infundibulicybe gibba]|nr:hypothetical protein BD779DRAFT_722287 [Infundibulicybe gibba]
MSTRFDTAITGIWIGQCLVFHPAENTVCPLMFSALKPITAVVCTSSKSSKNRMKMGRGTFPGSADKSSSQSWGFFRYRDTSCEAKALFNESWIFSRCAVLVTILRMKFPVRINLNCGGDDGKENLLTRARWKVRHDACECDTDHHIRGMKCFGMKCWNNIAINYYGISISMVLGWKPFPALHSIHGIDKTSPSFSQGCSAQLASTSHSLAGTFDRVLIGRQGGGELLGRGGFMGFKSRGKGVGTYWRLGPKQPLE